MKKALFLFAFLFLFVRLSALPVPAQEEAFVISASHETGRIGDRVKVTFSAFQNPGMAHAKLTLRYDNEKLLLLKLTSGDVFGETALQAQELSSPCALIWNAADGEEAAQDGTLCTAVFKLIGGGMGKAIPLELSVESGDIENAAGEEVPVVLQNGSLTVSGVYVGFSFVWVWILLGAALCCGGISVLLVIRKNNRHRVEVQSGKADVK